MGGVWCGAVLCSFLIIKPHIAPYNVVRCGSLQLAVQCGYSILRPVLIDLDVVV